MWFCEAFFYVVRGIFYLFWDTLKAFFSPFRRKRIHRDFGNEICLITGAAQGLGRLLAKELAKRQAVLVLWDIQERKLQGVVDEIYRESGTDVHAYVCDCSNREDIYKVADQVRREVGDVTVLINNAGVMSGQTIVDSSDESIEKTFRVNTLAHFWTVKAFLPWMLKYNYGYVVQISSIMAFQGIPRLGGYCASKAAAMSLSETLRWELKVMKKTGITVTCVCPYHINTEMFAGVTTNFSSLFKTLDAEYVVERILQAIDEKQFIVATPRIMYLLIFLKSILPTRTMDAITYLTGAHKAMETAVTSNQEVTSDREKGTSDQ